MIERVQYNASLAITGAIEGTSQLKIYKELGLESLKFRRSFRRLCFFYKLRSTQTPKYLYNLIPLGNRIYNTRNQLIHIIVEQIYSNTLSFHIL